MIQLQHIVSDLSIEYSYCSSSSSSSSSSLVVVANNRFVHHLSSPSLGWLAGWFVVGSLVGLLAASIYYLIFTTESSETVLCCVLPPSPSADYRLSLAAAFYVQNLLVERHCFASDVVVAREAKETKNGKRGRSSSLCIEITGFVLDLVFLEGSCYNISTGISRVIVRINSVVVGKSRSFSRNANFITQRLIL